MQIYNCLRKNKKKNWNSQIIQIKSAEKNKRTVPPLSHSHTPTMEVSPPPLSTSSSPPQEANPHCSNHQCQHYNCWIELPHYNIVFIFGLLQFPFVTLPLLVYSYRANMSCVSNETRCKYTKSFGVKMENEVKISFFPLHGSRSLQKWTQNLKKRTQKLGKFVNNVYLCSQ